MIYAHTVPGSATVENWQTLAEHQEGAADFATRAASVFDSTDWARVAALLHDLGKLDARFQRKLFVACGIPYPGKVGTIGVNHSDAGAAWAEQSLPPGVGRTLAYMIAGHHAGLPDYFDGWAARLEDAKENLKQIEDEIGPYVSDLCDLKAPPAFVNLKNYHLWVRMLFSCLVDADWLDTERFMTPKRFADRPKFPSLSKLHENFNERMSKFGTPAPGSLNALRNEILSHCREAAKQEPGLFSLTVPTGGGKTLSGMAFALDHAIRHGKERIIYVIPYTSIIEQTAKELRKIFGDENVLEHHSNVVRDEERADLDGCTPMDLAAENWDASIIVTTNVQFFESLYAAKPRRCRKIHNIANSVVLIDEAQLISPDFLDPCTDAIKHLTESFKTTVVLCTATQSKPKVLENAREIIPDPKKYYDALKRTEIHFPENLNEPTTWEDLAEELQEHEKVLCIVNTRLDCRTLYDLMPEGTIHLSALMCGEHRTAVISEIKRRLKEPGPLRVISTQLVEAGVDMDFPVVYRALAGLDSIVQAAGRCNREGKLPELGQVYVFIPPKPAPRGLLSKGENTTKSLIRQGKTDTNDPDLFAEYFQQFYGELNKTDKEEILEKLIPGRFGDVKFRLVGEKFRLIEDGCNVSILVRYGEGKELIERLEKEGPSRDLMKKLQRFTVNLDQRRADAFLQAGLIRKHEFYGDRGSVLIQNIPSCYTDALGLDIMRENISSDESVI